MMGLRRNAAANFFGALIPALVYVWSVPLMLEQLGDQGYGVFALLGSIVGYFAVMDLNMSSGALRFVSHFNASRQRARVDEVVTFGVAAAGFVGLLGMALLMALAPWIVSTVVNAPGEVLDEAAAALRCAAVGFLFSQIASFLQGTVQALQRYDVSGAFELVSGIATPALTVALLAGGCRLDQVMLARGALAAVNALGLALAVRHLLPGLAARKASRAVLERMGSFVSYAYLSRVAALAYVEGDKLILGAMLGPVAVALYAIPQALVSRIYGLTYRLGAVVMPAASTLEATGRESDLRRLGLVAARYTLYLNAAIALLLVICSGPLLSAWLDASRAASVMPILVLLLLAAVINSMTNVPSLVTDGLGKTRVTGLFAITHAVVGFGATVGGIRVWGVQGAAAAQLATSLVMMALFNAYAAGRSVPWSLASYLRSSVLPSVPVLLLAALAAFAVVANASGRATLVAAPLLLGLTLAYGFAVVLHPEHRAVAVRRMRHPGWR